MDLQAGISADKIGSHISVLVDNIDQDGTAIAHSYAEAPNIDGDVFIEHATGLQVGDFVEVVINDASEYDLWGKVVS